MVDFFDVFKYCNVVYVFYIVVKEEGFSVFYRGVLFIVFRQGSNQVVNFIVYIYFKEWLYQYQFEYVGGNFFSYQIIFIGFVFGVMGFLSNVFIDIIKIRFQKMKVEFGIFVFQRIIKIVGEMFKQVYFFVLFYKMLLI